MLLSIALILGIAAGLRAMTSPAAVSWAARIGLVAVAGTPLAFMGARWTPIIFTVLAIGELVNDKLPGTPSRKVPPQFIARIVMGGLSGATVMASHGQVVVGILAGALGAVAGTYGGPFLRQRLAQLLNSPVAAALIEDGIAICLAVTCVMGAE